MRRPAIDWVEEILKIFLLNSIKWKVRISHVSQLKMIKL